MNLTKKKILLVDDDPNIVRMTKNRLEANKFEVATASNGIECMQAVRAEKPDLILLDLAMPKMDGFTVVKELKADPATEKIPIIILTGKGATRDLLEQEGVAGFVPKPFQADELLGKIRNVLLDTRSEE